MSALKIGLYGARIGAIATSAAFSLLQATITFGISLAIQGVTTLITGWINANREARQRMLDVINTNSSLIQSFNNLKKEYNDIINSTDEESEKNKKLAEYKEKLITQYGFEKDALDGVNLSRATGNDLLDGEILKSYNKIIAESTSTYEKAKKAIEDYNTIVSVELPINDNTVTDALREQGLEFNILKHITGEVYESTITLAKENGNFIEVYSKLGEAITDIKKKQESGVELNVHEKMTLEGLESKYRNFGDILKKHEEIYNSVNDAYAQSIIIEQGLHKSNIQTKEDYDNLVNSVDAYTTSGEIQKTIVKELAKLYPEFSGAVRDNTEALNDNADSLSKSFSDSFKDISEITDKVKSLSTAWKEYSDTGIITASTLSKLQTELEANDKQLVSLQKAFAAKDTKGIQKAIADIATEFISAKMSTMALTEETLTQIEADLKSIGVKLKVVEQQKLLSIAEANAILIKNDFVEMTNDKSKAILTYAASIAEAGNQLEQLAKKEQAKKTIDAIDKQVESGTWVGPDPFVTKQHFQNIIDEQIVPFKFDPNSIQFDWDGLFKSGGGGSKSGSSGSTALDKLLSNAKGYIEKLKDFERDLQNITQSISETQINLSNAQTIGDEEGIIRFTKQLIKQKEEQKAIYGQMVKDAAEINKLIQKEFKEFANVPLTEHSIFEYNKKLENDITNLQNKKNKATTDSAKLAFDKEIQIKEEEKRRFGEYTTAIQAAEKMELDWKNEILKLDSEILKTNKELADLIENMYKKRYSETNRIINFDISMLDEKEFEKHIGLIEKSVVATEEEIARVLATGVEETDEYLQELQKKLLGFNKEIEDLNRQAYSNKNANIQFKISMLNEKEYKAQIKLIQQSMEAAEQEMARLRASGFSESDSYYQSLLKQHQDWVKQILNINKQLFDEQKSDMDSAHAAVLDYIDSQVDALNQKKKELQEITNLQQKEIELMRLQDSLASARNQKMRIYSETDGFQWIVDDKKVKAAENDLAKFKKDQEIAELDKTIDKWGEYRKLWESIPTEFEKSQRKIIADAVMGANWEQMILEKRLDIVQSFADKYNEIMANRKAIDDMAYQQTDFNGMDLFKLKKERENILKDISDAELKGLDISELKNTLDLYDKEINRVKGILLGNVDAYKTSSYLPTEREITVKVEVSDSDANKLDLSKLVKVDTNGLFGNLPPINSSAIQNSFAVPDRMNDFRDVIKNINNAQTSVINFNGDINLPEVKHACDFVPALESTLKGYGQQIKFSNKR